MHKVQVKVSLKALRPQDCGIVLRLRRTFCECASDGSTSMRISDSGESAHQATCKDEIETVQVEMRTPVEQQTEFSFATSGTFYSRSRQGYTHKNAFSTSDLVRDGVLTGLEQSAYNEMDFH